MIKIKTSVGKYPTMNYMSLFSNDEIYEGKKCLLNRMRRMPEPEPRMDSPTTAKKHHIHAHGGAFALNV